VHLAASDTLYREKGTLIVGSIICGPCLDAEILVRAAEKEGRHLKEMACLANEDID
jgi:hypothetical protein